MTWGERLQPLTWQRRWQHISESGITWACAFVLATDASLGLQASSAHEQRRALLQESLEKLFRFQPYYRCAPAAGLWRRVVEFRNARIAGQQ